MGDISWTDRSDWNPVRGCTRVSPGCQHCYAETMAGRFSDEGRWGHGFAERTAAGGRWTGKVELQRDRLTIPLSWRRAAKVFPNSASDFFHAALPDEDIDLIFAVMALTPHLTYQPLTKRADRMRAYLTADWRYERIYNAMDRLHAIDSTVEPHPFRRVLPNGMPWPLPNVWLGVSVEDQQRADERVPELLATPAAVRFLSCEPLLGPVDLRPFLWASASLANPTAFPMTRGPRPGEAIAPAGLLDWVIVGGESGRGARPMQMRWLHDVVSQCQAAGVAVWVKQLGAKPMAGAAPYRRYVPGSARDLPPSDRKGANPAEWPEYLRVQQFPEVRR